MLLIGLSGKAGHGKDTVADYLVEKYGFLKFGFADPLYDEVAKAFELTEDEVEHYIKTREVREIATGRFALHRCKDKDFVNRVMNDLSLVPDGVTWLSARQIMVWWGTEYRRAQDEDYWVKQAALFVQAFCETRKRTVTTKAEAQRVAAEFGMPAKKARNGRVIKPEVPLGSTYYEDFPGLVNTNVRFENEARFIRDNDGTVWRIERPGFVQNAETAGHSSEQLPVLRTGDKLLINNSSVDRLRTAVSIMLRGHVGIVNSGDQDDEEARQSEKE